MLRYVSRWSPRKVIMWADKHGCTSLMALVGSALVLILNFAFSFGLSTKSNLATEPLLLLRPLLPRPNLDLGRDMMSCVVEENAKRLVEVCVEVVREKT